MGEAHGTHGNQTEGEGQRRYLVAAEVFVGILSTPWGFAVAGLVFSLHSAGGCNGFGVLVPPQGRHLWSVAGPASLAWA